MKFYYIITNPKWCTLERYNKIAKEYPLPIQWVMDFRHDVETYEVKEVTPDEFNIIMNKGEFAK